MGITVTAFPSLYAGVKPGKKAKNQKTVIKKHPAATHTLAAPGRSVYTLNSSSQTHIRIGDLKTNPLLTAPGSMKQGLNPTNNFPDKSSYEKDGRYQQRSDYDPQTESVEEDGRYAAVFPGQQRESNFSANFNYRKEYGQQSIDYIHRQKELDRQKREAEQKKAMKLANSVFVDVKGFRDLNKLGINFSLTGDSFEEALRREFRRQIIEYNGSKPLSQELAQRENREVADPAVNIVGQQEPSGLASYFHQQTRQADEYPVVQNSQVKPQPAAPAQKPAVEKPAVTPASAAPAPSMLAMFHRDDMWEEPAWMKQAPSYTPRPKEVSSVHKSSRIALEAQAALRGIARENYEHKTNDELQVMIDQFDRALLQKAQPPLAGLSAKDIAGEDAPLPPFIRQNFIPETELYTEPWNPAVSHLRLLVVDDPGSWIDLFTKQARFDGRVTVSFAAGGHEAMKRLEKEAQAYDIVLVNENISNGTGSELSMWMWEQHITCPVVSISNASAPAEDWHAYNTVGKISMDHPMQELLNYASNLVATGKAYPGR